MTTDATVNLLVEAEQAAEAAPIYYPTSTEAKP